MILIVTDASGETKLSVTSVRMVSTCKLEREYAEVVVIQINEQNYWIITNVKQAIKYVRPQVKSII